MDAPASEEAPDQAAQYIASLTQELAEIARRKGLSVGERALAARLVVLAWKTINIGLL